MKKTIPILLCLLFLSACGQGVTVPEVVSEEPLPTQETAPTAPIEKETEEPMISPEPEVNQPEVFTLDGLDSYLRLTLPDGWTWKEEDNGENSVYVLYPVDDGDFRLRVTWWKESFGICGTGVTIQPYTLANGDKATLATEQIGESLSWILILPPRPDQFVLDLVVPSDRFEAHRAELDELMASIQTGTIAHLTDPVRPKADM